VGSTDSVEFSQPHNALVGTTFIDTAISGQDLEDAGIVAGTYILSFLLFDRGDNLIGESRGNVVTITGGASTGGAEGEGPSPAAARPLPEAAVLSPAASGIQAVTSGFYDVRFSTNDFTLLNIAPGAYRFARLGSGSFSGLFEDGFFRALARFLYDE